MGVNGRKMKPCLPSDVPEKSDSLPTRACETSRETPRTAPQSTSATGFSVTPHSSSAADSGGGESCRDMRTTEKVAKPAQRRQASINSRKRLRTSVVPRGSSDGSLGVQVTAGSALLGPDSFSCRTLLPSGTAVIPVFSIFWRPDIADRTSRVSFDPSDLLNVPNRDSIGSLLNFLRWGEKCFAPRCKTGYKSCTEKLSLFSAPREEERLRVWRNAILRKDRILQSTDHLCERHFEPHLVSKTWEAVYNGTVLCRAPRKASLSKDAVPTIFLDCPSYLSKEKKQRKRPAERRDINGPIKKHRKQSQELGDSLLLDPPESGATASDVILHDCTSALLAAVSTFDELFGSPASVEFPSTTWGFHRLQVDELRNVVFSELWRVREPQCAADTSHIVPWKLLDINQDMQLSVVLMGRPVSPEVLGFDLEVSTINDITTLLKNLENLYLCGGGPTANEYPHALLECVLVDVCGRWRHRKCAQVLSANGACQRCADLSDTLRVHQRRALLRKN
ncbi:hypothetical protein HPB51_000874 [Rhipicephalus microplus]|uniref:THAP-type domain-containing protein n=1 Tax=Rhipicephalus microplus TaxID=6941 RepID=A0A9J6D8C5_RHIMP|nr:hypothetical protein HPB51_000874 [Rhipicephalus microplus]